MQFGVDDSSLEKCNVSKLEPEKVPEVISQAMNLAEFYSKIL